MIKIVLAASLAVMSTTACSAVDTDNAYDEAMQEVIKLTETTGKPMYNGSYFSTILRSPAHCQIEKVVTYYDKTDAIEKVSTTQYAIDQIDPAKISADHIGGVKFWSIGEKTVFHMQHSQGSDFSAILPGDNLTVRDEDSETQLLIDALKTLNRLCTL